MKERHHLYLLTQKKTIKFKQNQDVRSQYPLPMPPEKPHSAPILLISNKSNQQVMKIQKNHLIESKISNLKKKKKKKTT